MDFSSQDLMYEFHARDLTQTEALKQYADHAVKGVMRQIHRMTERRISHRRKYLLKEQVAS